MNADEVTLINQTIEKFILNPENFVLFRGEKEANKGGLHFALDKGWAKNFGDNILEGNLPAGSKIKSITKTDLDKAFSLGLTSEQPVWNLIFLEGYDAILGTDFMDSNKLDVIVNPKHLERFKPL
jgi:hypothetical protein